jgi:hypothetical protein
MRPRTMIGVLRKDLGSATVSPAGSFLTLAGLNYTVLPTANQSLQGWFYWGSRKGQHELQREIPN